MFAQLELYFGVLDLDRWGVPDEPTSRVGVSRTQPLDQPTKAALAFGTLPGLDTMSRYEARYDRQFNRALAALRSVGFSLQGASARLQPRSGVRAKGRLFVVSVS
jgi:hypothetical protein